MAEQLYNLQANHEALQTLQKIILERGGGSIVESAGQNPRRPVGEVIRAITQRFVLLSDWSREDEGDSYWAKAAPVVEDGQRHVESKTVRNVSIVYPDINGAMPASSEGDQVYASYRNARWELLEVFQEDDPVGPKELFPVLYYEHVEKDATGDPILDENEEVKKTRYILCPGGNTEHGPTRKIYALNLETKKWDSAKFPNIPIAVFNMGGTIVETEVEYENTEGEIETAVEHEMVLGSGQTEQVNNNTFYFYNFEQNQWREAVHVQNFAGCPIIWTGEKNDGNEVAYLLAGQGSVYLVQNTTTGWWFYSTIWEINIPDGTVTDKLPRRASAYMNISAIKEQVFLKSNFKGFAYRKAETDQVSGDTKTVDFLAFGGTASGNNFEKSVTSYTNDNLVNTAQYDDSIAHDKVITMPDAPVLLGECCAEHVTRRTNFGGGMQAVDAVLCLGGRVFGVYEVELEDDEGNPYTEEREGYIPHAKVYYLNIPTKTWFDDVFPEVPIPRWNAGSIVLKDHQRTIVVDEESGETETVFHDLLLLLGGRNRDGLLADVDVLNLSTGEWELDWPDFRNKIRPKPIEEEEEGEGEG